MAQTVFISYSQADKQAADRICEILEQGGVDCWIAPRNIPAGTTWANSIVRGIERSRAMVLVCSENANQSRQMSRELQLADDHKLPIIPIRLSSAEPSGDFRYFLDNTQWFDAFPGTMDDHAERLLRAVKAALLPPGERTAATAAGWGAQAAAVAGMKPTAQSSATASRGPVPVAPAPAGGQKKTGLIVAVAAVVVAVGGGSMYLFRGQASDSKPPVSQPEQPVDKGPGAAEPVTAPVTKPGGASGNAGTAGGNVTPPAKPAMPVTRIPFVLVPPGEKFPYGFRMGQTPVTGKQLREFLAATNQNSDAGAVADDDSPATGVEPKIAKAFCEWATEPGGKGRLPERDDFSYAALISPSLAIGKQVAERTLFNNAARGRAAGDTLVFPPARNVEASQLGFRCMADAPR